MHNTNAKFKLKIPTKGKKNLLKNVPPSLMADLTEIFYQHGSISYLSQETKIHRNTLSALKATQMASQENIDKLSKVVSKLKKSVA